MSTYIYNTHTQIPETCGEFDLGAPARDGAIKDDSEWLEEWTQVCLAHSENIL
jgi:hypothetical protein